MSEAASRAVFLSYASQDAEAAKKICEALRAAGSEVWFDQSELVGGDQWDQKIRKQIRECALFIPILSLTTQSRREAYFRLEWKLADERTHLMARGTPFLLPVTIDATNDQEALVPDSFLAVQWTKLPGGNTPPAFAARVKRLLAGETSVVGGAFRPGSAEASGHKALPTPAQPKWLKPILASAAIVIAVLAFTLIKRSSAPLPPAPVPATPPSASIAAPVWPRDADLRRARHLLYGLDAIPGDFALADDLVKPLLAARPNDPEVVTVAAEVAEEFVARGFDTSDARREQAQRLTERAVALASDNPVALAALARYLLFVNSQLPRAEELARRAIALAPDEPRSYRMLYSLLALTKPGPETAAFEARMVARFPADPLVHYDVARRYKDENNLPAMEAWLDRTLALAPVTAALVWKAWLELEMHGNVAGMKAALDRVSERQQVVPRVVAAFAVRASLTGETDKAARLLNALGDTWLADFDFTGPKTLLAGNLLSHDGREELARLQYEAALAEIEQAEAREPTNARLRRAELWTLLGLGNQERARGVLRLVVQAEEQRPAANGWSINNSWWNGAMRAALLLGERDEALRLFRKAATQPTGRLLLRKQFHLDPRMAPFQADPQIKALLAEPADATAPLVDDKSVAVLAFSNLSDDKANEYFSDGISEELLNVLAKIPDLKVSARTSAFSFKGKEVAIPEIARQLGVAYVVEGSVRRQGDKVRITAQLIKAADGFHVWSDTFTREVKDVFAVQDEIAGLIAKNLQLTLQAKRGPSLVNPEAYELLLKGRAFLSRGQPAEYPQGIQYLKDSLAIDPGSAVTWGRLANGYALAFAQNVPGWLPRDEIIRLAREAADRALELDPEEALGHRAQLLIAYLADWDWARADASMQRVLALTPNDAEALGAAATLQLTAGHPALALEMARRAVRLDPLNFQPFYQVIKAQWQSGDYEELEKESKRLIAIYPHSPYGPTYLCFSFLLRGRADAAAKVAEQVTSDAFRLTSLALAHYAQGKVAESDAELERLKTQFGPTYAYQVAENYAFRKDLTQAFAWLETSYQQRDSGLTLITNDPFLKNLRGDVRWSTFMRKMNLPAGGTK